MKNILILDDHKVILNLVGSYLEQNLNSNIIRVESIDDLKEIDSDIDIYIIDMSLDKGNGFDVLDFLIERNASSVIIYTSNINPGVIKHLYEHKLVKAIVNKASDESSLLEAVNTVLSGDKYICSRSESIINSSKKSYYDLKPKETELTNRQREILQLIWENYSSDQIAEKLGISKFTVEGHRKNIKRKLGADSLVTVIKIAMDKGYINTLEK